MRNTFKRLTATVIAVATMVSVSATAISANEWVKADTGYKYELDNGDYQKKSSWVTVGKDKYYINSKGVRATGSVVFTAKDGTKKYYYFDKNTGKMKKSSWVTMNGEKYFYRSSGERATGMTLKISGKSYTFDETGAISTGKATTTTKTTTTTNTAKALTDKPATVTFTTKVMWHNLKKTKETRKSQVYMPGTPVPTDVAGQLIVVGDGTAKDYDQLKYFSNLTVLKITYVDISKEGWNLLCDKEDANIHNLTNLDFLNYMPNLTVLHTLSSRSLKDISGVSACKKLTELRLEYGQFGSIEAIESLTKLEKLYLRGVTNLKNLDGIGGCKNLKMIQIYTCHNLVDITDMDRLSDCSNELDITITQSHKFSNLKGVENLTKLKSLDVAETNVSDLTPIITLSKTYTDFQVILKFFKTDERVTTPAVNNNSQITTLRNKGVIVGNQGIF